MGEGLREVADLPARPRVILLIPTALVNDRSRPRPWENAIAVGS
jgi:hypothetical protein